MEWKRNGQRTAAVIVPAVVLALVASLLLAPMVFPGMCTDSAEPSESYCTDLPAQTLLGFPAHVGLWVTVLAAIAVATAASLVWSRSRRST